MIHVAVYGTMRYSNWMKTILEGAYSDLMVSLEGEAIGVDAFVENQANPLPEGCISIAEFAQKYHAKELCAIIIPKEYYLQYNELMQQLIKAGINLNDIYNGARLYQGITENVELLAGVITPMLSDPYLAYLEYHVADHCNLNCKYCTHYSPLVMEPVFTDLAQFQQDLKQFKKHIDDVGVFRILGGEPLLNPELPQFIAYTRSLYPNSIITVVTNGMILDKISDELIQAMQDNLAFFHISFYPPLEKRISTIKQFLVDKKIPFTISPLIKKFNKIQKKNPTGNADFYYDCFQGTCFCLHQGKVAQCYAAFTTKYFNAAFAQDLPTDEGIDLYEEALTTEDLKLRLLYPMKRCEYCVEGDALDWEIVGKHSTLEDWVEE